jgi:hypothetical protein
VTTTIKPNPADLSTTTTTQFQTTPPGIVLPQGTYLPMGASPPAGGTLVAPGAAMFNSIPPAFPPGTVPNTQYPSATQPQSAGGATPAPGAPTAPAGPKPAAGSPVPGTPAPTDSASELDATTGWRGDRQRDPARAVDSNVLTASAQGRRSGQPTRPFSDPTPRRASSTTRPAAGPSSQPAPRKSLLSRLFGGSR